jgi:hypothetical protein
MDTFIDDDQTYEVSKVHCVGDPFSYDDETGEGEGGGGVWGS